MENGDMRICPEAIYRISAAYLPVLPNFNAKYWIIGLDFSI
jgi:hypothetical protein